MRFRPRFSLRTLLIVVTLSAVACWGYWIGWPWWQYGYDQQRFVESVKLIKAGISTKAASQMVHAGSHCSVQGYGDRRFDHAAARGYLYIWPNAIYCVHYVARWTGVGVGRRYDEWGPIVSVEVFKLHAMPPSYQSHNGSGQLAYADDFARSLLDDAKNTPGFDYELVYTDPPVKMAQLIITHLPLTSPAPALGYATKRSDLAISDITKLLQRSAVRFVVADVGMPLQWVDKAGCFDFWKQEVRMHVSDRQAVSLDEFPGGYCYFASLWDDGDDGGLPIVLLSKCH
jgi:hypothetical protein